MVRFKVLIATLLLLFSFMSVTLTVATPSAFAAGSGCNSGFLTFPAWYNGLTNSDCTIKSPDAVGGISTFIWIIVLNVVDIILQLIGYVAALMIIYGGFRYLTSTGTPSGVEQAKKTLTNAIIGLVLAIASIAIVNLLFGVITGKV